MSRRFPWMLMVAFLGGCQHALPEPNDDALCSLPLRVRDVEPPLPPRSAPTAQPASSDTRPQPAPAIQPVQEGPRPADGDPPLQLAAAEQLPGLQPLPVKPLAIPPGLPGSAATPIRWDPQAPDAEKARRVQELYPDLPPLPPDTKVAPGPDGQPLSLAELQSLAAAHNPNVKAALDAVKAAEGAVRQAGAYPNPSVFWEADTVGTAGAGYQGAGVDQVIKGANKLKLQKAMAEMDLRNAQVALRKAESDLATQVRNHYFAVLVALENVKVSRALAEFTNNIYRAQVDLLRRGFAAPYEPMQLRPLVLQAQFNWLQAQNQYLASWKQLAGALGLPNMPPTELTGRVDLPIPQFDFEEVRQHILARHTDVLTALKSLQRARYALEFARVTPYPDYDVHALYQKDYTTPPHLFVYSLSVTVPVPVWDQNKGAITQAEYQLYQASEGPHQAELNLLNSLADAWNRYATARQQVALSLKQIEDQVRAYRAVYERRSQQPDQVAFGDVVTAQQTLVGYVSAYITALGLQWTAVVDVANLLQTDDLWGPGPREEVAPVPDLKQLLPQPCTSAPGRSRPGEEH